MRTKDPSHLDQLLSPVGQAIRFSDPLGQILAFALCHRDCIADEIGKLDGMDSVSKWSLELTTTSLFWLLSYWGERFECIDVYCDRSKPLETDLPIFDVMIGRRDKAYQRFGSHREVALTFNLKGPINLVDSHQSHGVQIADVLSSSISYALRNPEKEQSKTWLSLATDMISEESVVPNSQRLDLNQRDPFINAMVLGELVDRTVKRSSLIAGMPEFIADARQAYQQRFMIDEP